MKIAVYALLSSLAIATHIQAAETVLVAGATGRTGIELIKLLKTKGYDVRALARNVEQARQELGDSYEWVKADVRNKAQVDAAFRGRKIDYVISAIGSREWIGANSPQFVDYVGTKNLAEAALAAKVKHFVVISVGNIGPHVDQKADPAFGYLQYWKMLGEDAVKTSGTPYTIVGPGGLRETPAGVKGIKLTARKDYKTAGISIGDTAAIAIEALTNPAARNKSFGAVNDETRQPGTWANDLKLMPEESVSQPRIQIDPKTNTSLTALDTPEAAIQRYAYTSYATQIRGQEIPIPNSASAFCTLSNESRTYLNYFPAQQQWKIQMLHDPDPNTLAGGIVTCHSLAAAK